jgi:hypothetical protein
MRLEVRREQVRPGEGWAGAADRMAGGRGPVLAVDLSGDPLVFRLDDEHVYAVRPLTAGDFDDLTRWVNTPHVARWWDERRTPEQVAAYYGAALHGEDPTRLWIWEVNGRSVGFAQDYRIADHPD